MLGCNPAVYIPNQVVYLGCKHIKSDVFLHAFESLRYFFGHTVYFRVFNIVTVIQFSATCLDILIQSSVCACVIIS